MPLAWFAPKNSSAIKTPHDMPWCTRMTLNALKDCKKHLVEVFGKYRRCQKRCLRNISLSRLLWPVWHWGSVCVTLSHCAVILHEEKSRVVIEKITTVCVLCGFFLIEKSESPRKSMEVHGSVQARRSGLPQRVVSAALWIWWSSLSTTCRDMTKDVQWMF